jgi:hypothetical protein
MTLKSNTAPRQFFVLEYRLQRKNISENKSALHPDLLIGPKTTHNCTFGDLVESIEKNDLVSSEINQGERICAINSKLSKTLCIMLHDTFSKDTDRCGTLDLMARVRVDLFDKKSDTDNNDGFYFGRSVVHGRHCVSVFVASGGKISEIYRSVFGDFPDEYILFSLAVTFARGKWLLENNLQRAPGEEIIRNDGVYVDEKDLSSTFSRIFKEVRNIPINGRMLEFASSINKLEKIKISETIKLGKIKRSVILED